LTPFKVHLGADLDKPLLKEIAAAFGTLKAYQLTNNPEQANLQLYLLRPKQQDGQLIYGSPDDTLPKSFPNQPPELWILTPDQRLFKKGLKIPFSNQKKGLQLLQIKLKKMARARELKALKSHRTLPVNVQTYLLRKKTSCPKGANCVQLSDYGLGLHLKKGPLALQNIEKLNKNDILSFSLHNQSQKDYYCYLIQIDPTDDIHTIFPDNTESAHLKKGEKRKVSSLLLMDESGDNTIQIITSTVQIDISLLEEPRSDSNDEWATGQVSIKVIRQ